MSAGRVFRETKELEEMCEHMCEKDDDEEDEEDEDEAELFNVDKNMGRDAIVIGREEAETFAQRGGRRGGKEGGRKEGSTMGEARETWL